MYHRKRVGIALIFLGACFAPNAVSGKDVCAYIAAQIEDYRPNATKIVAPNTTLIIFCRTTDISWKFNGDNVNNWGNRSDGLMLDDRNYSRNGGIITYSDTISLKVTPLTNNTKVECFGKNRRIGMTTVIVAGMQLFIVLTKRRKSLF